MHAVFVDIRLRRRAGGELRVHGVRGELRRGEIYVLDSGNHLLKIFSPDGTFLRSFGPQGEGPGEFQQMAMAMVLSDEAIERDELDVESVVVYRLVDPSR